jgi:crossover junction endodeoxyribonuclease RusA
VSGSVPAEVPVLEPRQWVIGLPWSEPPLSLNVHRIRAHEARLAREIRADTGKLVRAARVPALPRVQVVLHWQPTTNRVRDVENPVPTLKHCCDAIVDAGVVEDDDPPRMVKGMPVIHPPVKGRAPSMWLVLVELDAVPDAPAARAQPKPRKRAATRVAPGRRLGAHPRVVDLGALGRGVRVAPSRYVPAPGREDRRG